MKDIKTVAPILIDWLKRNPEVSLAIMGSEDIFSFFKRVPKNQRSYTKPGDLSAYYRFVSSLDIGLAPLEDTGFNRCRSDVKYIEYAGFGAITVARKLAPYKETIEHGKNGYLYETPSDLVKVLDHLLENPDERLAVRRTAYSYVLENRIESMHSDARMFFYSSLVSKRNPTRLDVSISSQAPAVLSDVETMLYNGLVLMETLNNKEKAMQLFEEAAKSEPQHDLPFLYMSKCVKDPIPYFEEALKRNPKSLQALLLLGDACVSNNQAMPALQAYEKAASTYSGWDAPYLRTARLLEAMNMSDQAAILRKKAASLQITLDTNAIKFN